jgi:hypothetical protein
LWQVSARGHHRYVSETQPEQPAVEPEAAYPQELAEWRQLAGEPDPQALEWARRALGVNEPDRRTA